MVKKAKMVEPSIDGHILSAVNVIKAHPSVRRIVEGPTVLEKAFTLVVAEFDVPLPSRVINNGVSATGVYSAEPVAFLFHPNYPLKAPRIRLRVDFNRSLPHINPGRIDEPVNPCIYDGSLDDLLHQSQGLNGLLNQVATWLRKAAGNMLIDNKQGWEPARRDSVIDHIIYDVSDLRQRISSKEGAHEFLCHYILLNDLFIGRLFKNNRPFYTAEYLSDLYQNTKKSDKAIIGDAFSIFVWPSERDSSGKPIITDTYLPEDIADLDGLLRKADLYGCKQILQFKLQQLFRCYKNVPNADDNLLVVVTLCARRPIRLINDNSNCELLSYLVECRRSSDVISGWDVSSPVRPLGHRHAISASLLGQMSGKGTKGLLDGEIVQLGCGSLGSKIVIHLARCGYGPFTLVDNKIFSPHNMARHALADLRPIAFWQNKAVAMKEALSQLDQTANAIDDDIVTIASRCLQTGNFVSKKSKLIIDSTASLSVREALASIPHDRISGRLIHTALYSHGKMGIFLLEGKERNPRIDDLIAAMYDHAIDNAYLRNILQLEQDPFRRQEIGQGCGSYTMVLPDTLLSTFAASMAERIRQLIEENLASENELLVGTVGQDNISIVWQRTQFAKTVIATMADNKKWEVRMLAHVANMIDQESKTYGKTETGGVLFGKVHFARRCAIVTRLLPAPPDSTRNGTAFTLGIEGLKKNVMKTQEASGNLLTYLGTWHSHPMDGGPSSRDRQTLQRMKELRLGWPTINLIWSSGKYLALLDEGDAAID